MVAAGISEVLQALLIAHGICATYCIVRSKYGNIVLQCIPSSLPDMRIAAIGMFETCRDLLVGSGQEGRALG